VNLVQVCTVLPQLLVLLAVALSVSDKISVDFTGVIMFISNLAATAVQLADQVRRGVCQSGR
jgi:hypothetical protein